MNQIINNKIDNGRTLTISVYLIGIFLVTEAVGGILANSLTLLADAGHMLSDFFAVILSLIAYKYESKPADRRRSYGYSRMQIIASFVNGITLVGISIVVSITAVIRIFNPPEVESETMLLIAVIGIIVNTITLILLRMSREQNLNMKGAILHVLGDLLGFISAGVGAIVIKYTGWWVVDPILSILIGCLILNSAIRLIRSSLHILMEGAPDNLKSKDIRHSLLNVKGVVDVQHIHLWLLNDSYAMATLHLLVEDSCDPFEALKQSKQLLLEKGRIQHSTIEVERYDPKRHLECNYNHHHRFS